MGKGVGGARQRAMGMSMTGPPDAAAPLRALMARCAWVRRRPSAPLSVVGGASATSASAAATAAGTGRTAAARPPLGLTAWQMPVDQPEEPA